MNTPAEIESAADALTQEEKQKLISFLVSRLKGETPAEHETALTAFSGTIYLSQDPLAWQRRVRGERE
ncbi:MAG: hypothetical protein DME97_14110 [Verrucomicrobia bacterium]|nr:MAG: hypothetical protein DME97_14110 [Verrucomicrobiota bacterium]